MEPFFGGLLYMFLFYTDLVNDPTLVAFTDGRQAVQELDCERLSQAEANARYPGRVPPPSARGGALFQIDALVCRHHVVPEGARSPRDEAILAKLEDEVSELVALASVEGGTSTQWLVDAYYPNPALVRKIANASRVTMAERGMKVSDRPPRLTAGDVEVLRTLPMREALPVACRRLFSSGLLEGGPLGDDVGFLSIALLHDRESQLHAGLCKNGTFRWLR